MRMEVTRENFYRRLDKFLRNQLKDVPLSVIYKLIRKGKVYVNRKRVKDPSFDLEEGDVVELRHVNLENLPKRSEKKDLTPVPMKLDVLYEDDHYLVLNKPPNIAIHPGKGVHVATLIEGLLYYGQEKGFSPFLVHRLDKETSGLLVVAKNREAARILTELFKGRNIEKEYVTLVRGVPENNMKITIPLDGQEAVSEIVSVKPLKDVSLLRVKIHTGRKHQIRRHLSQIGFPVVGDDTYGDRHFNREFRKRYGLKRQFLHSYRMKFIDPWTEEEKDFRAPLPDDLLSVLNLLEERSDEWLEEFLS
ncbi:MULTISPECIES: RluA family pseudouridine synthase [unclassified Thermotoga]|uniref:RluA family pseudouridine synthase n=1 Tax=unclassified Thermotoga TaxID=2631113 RepID=UPI000280EAD1|nr:MULTISPECIES: RluA family pseudouridine synthase [unclassified Thermotoga]AIY87363.1 Pseudouridine synthase [Thermotoga sp. 2812B]EJX26650.1 Pseudouridine synthase [Thermotoga sp. EMP]